MNGQTVAEVGVESQVNTKDCHLEVTGDKWQVIRLNRVA